MRLPVGLEDGLQRVDQALAVAERDVEGLSDLIHDADEIPPSVTSLLARKKAQIGHLRTDFAEMPKRLEEAR